MMDKYRGFTSMNEKDYREAIKRTMNTDLTRNEKIGMLLSGIFGEGGEIADSLKKHIYHGHPLDRDDLVKEFGDLEWYLQHLKMLFGIEDDEVRAKNITKLAKRYPNGFSEKASIERVDQ